MHIAIALSLWTVAALSFKRVSTQREHFPGTILVLAIDAWCLYAGIWSVMQ